LSQPIYEGYAIEMEVALEAVRRACRLCTAVQQERVAESTLTKQDASPVTVADYGAQAVVIQTLRQRFPADTVVGEEEASLLLRSGNASLKHQVVRHVQQHAAEEVGEKDILQFIDEGRAEMGNKGRFWVLDPIDGTKGFMRGDQYATALALIEWGEVVLGILGCPNLPTQGVGSPGPKGCLFGAVAGQGTRVFGLEGREARAVSVAQTSEPHEAVLCEPVESAHSSHGESAAVARQLGIRKPPYRLDSQCKYAAVARGDASIYLRLPTRAAYREKIWDHAAGSLLVREAGGQVTDSRGQPLDFSRGRTLQQNVGIIATNGKLHTEVVRAVQQALSAR